MQRLNQRIVTLSEAKGLRLGVGQRFFASLRMTIVAPFMFLFYIAPALADVSVTATVDRRQVALGESFAYTITLSGAQGGQPALASVDGLGFDGPSMQTSVSFVNGAMSQSASYAYRVTPTRTGTFTIPANTVEVGGRKYPTEPVQIVVGQGAVPVSLQPALFGRIGLSTRQVYLGQVVPLDVFIFARQELTVKGLSQLQAEADGLGYKYLQNVQTGSQIITGETYTVYRVSGVISPTKLGKLAFGPCVVKVQLATEKKGGRRGLFDDPLFDQVFGRVELREVPVPIEPVPVEVLPLPDAGKPADFTGAVGQWKLEVTGKPTAVNVGDPITMTIKISGDGNIDTVPTPSLSGLELFKTYDPTTKTTRNELGTQGERLFQQVLVPKTTDVKQLPEVRLAYFDPVAKSYQVARQSPITLQVRAGSGGRSEIVSGNVRLSTAEKFGQDIVYLKGDLGPVAVTTPFCATALFWLLNLVPPAILAGAVAWKRRAERLHGDVAYARRSRAARNARALLVRATSHDQAHVALQQYLGDRLNIPSSAITSAIVDEQLTPRGVPGPLAAELKTCFATCDAARFAGLSGTADVAALKQTVERLIDELENQTL